MEIPMHNGTPSPWNRAQLPSHLRYRLTKQDLVDIGFPEETIWPGGYDWDCRIETRPSSLQGAANREAVMERRVSRTNDGRWLVSAADGSGRVFEVVDPHDLVALLDWV